VNSGAYDQTHDGDAVLLKVKWFNKDKGFGFAARDGATDAFLHAAVLQRSGMNEVHPDAELMCEIGPGERGPVVTRVVSVLSEGTPQPFGGAGGDNGGGFNRDRGDRGDRGNFGAPRGDRGGFGGGGRDRGGDRGDRGGNFGAPRGDRGGFGGGGFDRGGDDFGGRPRRPAGGGAPLNEANAVETAGEVKWFNAEKGFGFVVPDDGGKDVFVHKSLLRRCGVEELQPGQRVLMKAVPVDRGREATWLSLM